MKWNDYLRRPAVAAALAVGVAILAILARVLLYELGVIYGDEALTRLTLIATGTAVVALALGLRWYRSTHGSNSMGSDQVALLASLVAIAVTLYGGLQLLFPNTPHQAAAQACRGAAVHGARALGQTTSLGVNARRGAGSAYAATDRFAANCTLGFDGFCLGEPTANPDTDLPDERWLLVHRRDEVVSAALIRLQSPLQDLGASVAKRCSAMNSTSRPRLTSFTALSAKRGSLVLTPSAQGAALVGFALAYPANLAQGAYPYLHLGFVSPAAGFVGPSNVLRWDLSKSPLLTRGTVRVVVAAEACYADDAPVTGTSIFRELTFINGDLTAAHDAKGIADTNAIGRQACAGR